MAKDIPFNPTLLQPDQVHSLSNNDYKYSTLKAFFLRLGFGLLIFLSGFVLFEPAPMDLLFLLIFPISFLFLVRIPRGIMPLISLILMFAGFGFLSVTQSPLEPWDAWLYLLVTGFLAVQAIYFASVIADNPLRHCKLLANVMIFVAVIITIIGVGAYFGAVPSSETFLRFGRVKSTFQDPNVFAPYLIYPACLCFAMMVYTKFSAKSFVYLGALAIIAIGVFFSFSRGGWVAIVAAFIMLFYCIFVYERQRRVRYRALALIILGAIVLIAALGIALSIPKVSELFFQRFALQDYDLQHGGRFDRYSTGIAMIFSAPFGYGPGHFAELFIEDPHNTFINVFWVHGWFGGLAYIAIVIWTLIKGLRIMHKQTPYQPFLFATWCTFLALVLLSVIIDTDHWRHWYMLLGILWGFYAVDAQKTMDNKRYNVNINFDIPEDTFTPSKPKVDRGKTYMSYRVKKKLFE